MGFFEKISAKIELFKLEQRYTKRSRRTTFICDAYYIDGEYIYGPSMTQKNLPNVRVSEMDSVSASSTKENRRRSVWGGEIDSVGPSSTKENRRKSVFGAY